MSAKEMFKGLGYEEINVIDIAHFVAYESSIEDAEIIFDNEKRTFRKQFLNSAVVKGINMLELQVINKQVEELGWNNE